MLIKEIKAEIKKFKKRPKITGLKKKELQEILDKLRNDNKNENVEGFNGGRQILSSKIQRWRSLSLSFIENWRGIRNL